MLILSLNALVNSSNNTHKPLRTKDVRLEKICSDIRVKVPFWEEILHDRPAWGCTGSVHAGQRLRIKKASKRLFIR